MTNSTKQENNQTYNVPYKLTNSVYLVNLNSKINLESIINSGLSYDYIPEMFPGLILRHPFKNIIFTLFSSGRVIITGIRANEDLRDALLYIKELLKKLGNNIDDILEVRCINRAYHFPDISKITKTKKIDLNNLVYYLKDAFYEPDFFPALLFRFRLPNGKLVSVTIFSNSKMILTGVTNEKELKLAKDYLFKVLEEAITQMNRQSKFF